MQSEFQEQKKLSNNANINQAENRLDNFNERKNSMLKSFTLEKNDYKTDKNTNANANVKQNKDIDIKKKENNTNNAKPTSLKKQSTVNNSSNNKYNEDFKANSKSNSNNNHLAKGNSNDNPKSFIKQHSNLTEDNENSNTKAADKSAKKEPGNYKLAQESQKISQSNNIITLKSSHMKSDLITLNQGDNSISNANPNSNTGANNNNNKGKLTTSNCENQILQRINSSEMRERRKSKILEMNNNMQSNNNNSQAAQSIRLSKDQMIKISNEPIQKYYNIISDLGHGSYGMVKKVKHKHIGEERAMKIVRKKLDSQNEIEILKKISHPNIISIYEIFEDSKNYYIMSELLEGGELFEEITRHGSFSEYEAANIMKQILNAVIYMHNKNIVHRDLKPENIMLISKSNSKFEIKIIDFGTAKLFEKGVKLTKFIGTSYYIAPEVLSESYDEKCDVWSCGVILYILLCGYPPFNGASNLDIYHAIKYSPPNFSGDEWKEVSREAVDLIKIMLNKFPQKRYSAEQCMQHKWFSMLNTDESSQNKDAIKPKFNQLKAINKMSKFVMENRLKQSVLQFISTQFNLKEEEKSLRQLFQQFDTEKKGYITYASFYAVLSKYFGENESKLISDKMFENLDLDGSGEISYNEFITAIIDNRSMVTNERLEKTFKMFDKVNYYNPYYFYKL